MQNLDLAKLATWLNGSNVEWLELTSPQGSKLCLRRGEMQAVAAPETCAAAPAVVTAVTSSVGIFLDHHPLRTTPFVQPGQAVAHGECIGLLQVGALLQSVTAPCSGVAGAYTVVSGHTVGYGTPVLPIHPV
jgi:acetyl-CoA carboxylase biotin carboxyl carrier protein